MNWTLRRVDALGAAICLTLVSTVGVSAGRARYHRRADHHNRSAKAPQSTISALHSESTKPSATIDRSTHGRAPFDLGLLAHPASRGENIARTALAYRGLPYRFGGRSPQSGFDCSGLVQAVCAKWGIYLPRASAAQFTRGKAVSAQHLQAGDLVFFKGTYKPGTSHVGIYIGEGQFVHAAGRGKGVRISALSDAYNQRHWAGARRFDLDRLPKTRDEFPVIASEVIVDRSAEAAAALSRLRPEAASGGLAPQWTTTRTR